MAWLGPPKEPTPRVIPGGTWIERHPTRYVFDPDVLRVVNAVFREFTDVSANTYAGHPEYDETRSWGDILGYNTQRRSVDFWHRDGRGVPILRRKGQRIVDFIFHDPDPPMIHWVIWRGRIWSRFEGAEWKPFDDDGTGLHFDHPHFTFMPDGWRP